LIFGRSGSAITEYAFYDGKEDHKSQGKISKIFHHIPKLPERSIEMENGRIDKGIVQGKSGNYQEWPKEEIDHLEDHIEYFPYARGIK
jgi:hypothetical protein